MHLVSELQVLVLVLHCCCYLPPPNKTHRNGTCRLCIVKDRD
jgi:hypothetical protein